MKMNGFGNLKSRLPWHTPESMGVGGKHVKNRSRPGPSAAPSPELEKGFAAAVEARANIIAIADGEKKTRLLRIALESVSGRHSVLVGNRMASPGKSLVMAEGLEAPSITALKRMGFVPEMIIAEIDSTANAHAVALWTMVGSQVVCVCSRMEQNLDCGNGELSRMGTGGGNPVRFDVVIRG